MLVSDIYMGEEYQPDHLEGEYDADGCFSNACKISVAVRAFHRPHSLERNIAGFSLDASRLHKRTQLSLTEQTWHKNHLYHILFLLGA